MKIYIRSAVLEDAPDMAEAYMRSWEVAYKNIVPADYIREKRKKNIAQTKRILNDENLNLFQYVILIDNAIVGVMTIAPARDDDTDDNFYELCGIYLHPDYYRQGIGTHAMDFAFDKARNLGKKIMTLWVFADNINSIKFYEKCGFAADGKTKILNCGKPLTAIRMRKDL